MLARSTFTDKVNGKKYVVEEEFEGYDSESLEFYFTEGNLACDCNRSTMIGLQERPCYPGKTIFLDKLEYKDKDGNYQKVEI